MPETRIPKDRDALAALARSILANNPALSEAHDVKVPPKLLAELRATRGVGRVLERAAALRKKADALSRSVDGGAKKREAGIRKIAKSVPDQSDVETTKKWGSPSAPGRGSPPPRNSEGMAGARRSPDLWLAPIRHFCYGLRRHSIFAQRGDLPRPRRSAGNRRRDSSMSQRALIPILLLLACSSASAQTVFVTDTEHGPAHAAAVDMGQFVQFGPDACLLTNHFHGASVGGPPFFIRFVTALNGDVITDPEFLVGDACGFTFINNPIPNVDLPFDPLLEGILSLGSSNSITNRLNEAIDTHKESTIEREADKRHQEAVEKTRAEQAEIQESSGGKPLPSDNSEAQGSDAPPEDDLDEHVDEDDVAHLQGPRVDNRSESEREQDEERDEKEDREAEAEARSVAGSLPINLFKSEAPLGAAAAFLVGLDASASGQAEGNQTQTVVFLIVQKLRSDIEGGVPVGEATAGAVEGLGEILGPNLAQNQDLARAFNKLVNPGFFEQPKAIIQAVQLLQDAIGFK